MKRFGLLLAGFGFAAFSWTHAAPTAYNSHRMLRSGGQYSVFLWYTDSSKPVDDMRFEILSMPSQGTLWRVSHLPRNVYYYQSESGNTGPDSFTWRCSDGSWSDQATFSITLNDNPVANDQSALVHTAVGACPQRIVLNSSHYPDYNRSGCSFTLTIAPTRGTLTWGAGQPVVEGVPVADTSALFSTAYANSRTWYYTPEPGYTGSDSFKWKWDYGGMEESGEATVSITAVANTMPVIADSTGAVNNGTRTSVTLDVADPDAGQWRTFLLVQAPAHGSVVMPNPTTENGSAFYTPFGGGFTGTDSFQWKVHDGVTESAVATVSITVTETAGAPLPRPQTALALRNVATPIPALYQRGGGYAYTLVRRSGPSFGSLTVCNETYRFLYTPDADFTGMDSFTWRISYNDGTGAKNSDTVTCDIQVCEALPLAQGRNVAIMKDQTVSLSVPYETSAVSHETLYWGSARPSANAILVAGPSSGAVSVSGSTFTYTPNPGWTGEDSFTWKINDGFAESNVATNRILVREIADRAGMTVLVVVRDLLLPEIADEINRLLADLTGEGYAPKLVSWPDTSAQALWEHLKAEYLTPGQFVSGAILIGNLPTARGLSSNQITDYAFMNMERYRDSGHNKQHIWVSRIIANNFAGGEALRIRWALDANHGYRSGTHRLPHDAYWDDHAYDAIHEGNAVNLLIAWPTIAKLHPRHVYRAGAEFQNSEIHSDGAFSSWDWHPSQLRFSIHSSCGPGRLGGPVNRNLLSRGGGMIVSVGSTATAFSRENVAVEDDRADYWHVLAAGDTLGHGMTRGVNPYRDYNRNVFYGDLSLPAKAAPANQVPVVESFGGDKTAGRAPLTVDFSLAAGDADGEIVRHEWFLNGFFEGVYGPEAVNLDGVRTHTYTQPRRYLAEAQAVDNWKARVWAIQEIRVAPEQAAPLRVQCGWTLTHFTPESDYTDGQSRLWLHDQAFAAGTWGYAGGGIRFVSDGVAGTDDPGLYQRFREGTSFSYRIPLANGGYTVILHFADMRSTGADQRILDIALQGIPRLTGLDVAAEAGLKTALAVPLNIAIGDGDGGELILTVARNEAATADPFLNAIEILPGLGPNEAPYAADATFAAEAGRETELTLLARDPENDPLIWMLVEGPSNGTLSGSLPNPVYTANADFSGTDSFTFKVSDGALDSRVATVSIEVFAVPVVALTAPANGATFAVPATLTIEADASISAGGIAKVEFFRDTVKLGEALAAPYTHTWSNATLSGMHALWARATSDAGVAADAEPVAVTLAAQNVYTWQSGVTGAYLDADNWTPEGFVNTNVNACVVADGVAQANGTFHSTLTLAGDSGMGGTLHVTASRSVTPNGIRLAGGRIWFTSSSSRTLTAPLEVLPGTVSRIQADTATLTHSGAIRGSGTLRVEGDGLWSLGSALLEEFQGRIEVTNGRLLLRSGTRAFGDNAFLRLNEGGTLSRGSSSSTWTLPGGVFLNGGTYRDDSSAGTTWSAATPWTIMADSVIETAGTGGFADILGPLHGSGVLTIRREAGSGERAVTLRGSGSTFSGTIRVTSIPANASLYIGQSDALPSSGALAALEVAFSGDVEAGLVVIGARKSGSSVTGIENVHVKVRRLMLDTIQVPAGVYNQQDPGLLEGYVVFHNASSSLEVVESVGEPDADGDGIPDWWEDLYFGGPTAADASAMAANGINTLLECYVAGLDPTDPHARFEISGVEPNGAGIVIRFNTIPGRRYGVVYKDALTNTVWQTLANDLPGDGHPKEATDPVPGPRRFYRIWVREQEQ